VVGASAANVAFLLIWGVFFQRADPDSFYLFITQRDFIAAMLNILLAGAVVAIVGWLAERSRRAWVARVADAGVVLGNLVVLNVLRQYLRLTPNDAGLWVGALGPGGTLALVLSIAAAGGATCWRWRPQLMNGLSLAYLALSPFFAITLGRAAWICASGDLDSQFASRAPEAPIADAQRPGRRVVLVVFDELDYRLAFANRPAGLALPALDALGRESLAADHAEPPAGNTNEALPSYLIGRRVARTEPVSTRKGRLFMADSSASVSTDSVTTLFRRARALGANSAMIGWNLPYCRTGLGDGLVRCAWWPSGTTLGVRESLGRTMLHQWVSISPVNSRAIHLIRHEEMMESALALVADRSLDLVVLHLVPPHYPWIFNEGTGKYTLMGFGARGYLGNLALADAALKELRDSLRRSGLAGRTTLVVTSDHPWRESRSLDGRMDPRVPFMVHVAGARGAVTEHRPFNTVVAGELCLALLSGSLTSAAGLPAWIEAHAAPSPPR
jgi:hypothetical protein